MSRDFPRSRRIEDQIQRSLSEIIRTQLGDPRMQGVVITGVDVSALGNFFQDRFDGLGVATRVGGRSDLQRGHRPLRRHATNGRALRRRRTEHRLDTALEAIHDLPRSVQSKLPRIAPGRRTRIAETEPDQPEPLRRMVVGEQLIHKSQREVRELEITRMIESNPRLELRG